MASGTEGHPLYKASRRVPSGRIRAFFVDSLWIDLYAGGLAVSDGRDQPDSSVAIRSTTSWGIGALVPSS